MQSNFELLKAKASAIDSKMNTQISCTRTRAVLLEVKKLCDQLRKDCLVHAKATKKARKDKKGSPTIVVDKSLINDMSTIMNDPSLSIVDKPLIADMSTIVVDDYDKILDDVNDVQEPVDPTPTTKANKATPKGKKPRARRSTTPSN